MSNLPHFLKSHFREIPDCYLRLPATAPIKGVLVAVHGISRNAAEIALRFSQSRDWDGWVIIAPLFEKQRFGQYQQLMARDGQTASDKALLMLLDRLELDYALDLEQVSLFGFSGGAQMVHRFALLHPHRVRKVYAMAAGWYMLPDANLPYPVGWSAVGAGRNAELARGLSVPMMIGVGSDDRGRDKALRRSPVIDQRLGTNRHNRARRWCGEMRKAAEQLGVQSNVEFAVIPDGTHDFGACVEHSDLLSNAADYLN
jgi:pimeloyl-ACP methyl ester carboxylesterase